MLPIPTPTLETYSPCPAGFHWSDQALSILLRSLSLNPLLDSHLFIPQGFVGCHLLQEAFFARLPPASVLDKCCPPSPRHHIIGHITQHRSVHEFLSSRKGIIMLLILSLIPITVSDA